MFYEFDILTLCSFRICGAPFITSGRAVETGYFLIQRITPVPNLGCNRCIQPKKANDNRKKHRSEDDSIVGRVFGLKRVRC